MFLKSKLKKGKYLLALEVFWETDYYTNINLSFHTEENEYVPYKLISSGSNFDIVFYKAFLSYYLTVLNPLKDAEAEAATFNAKPLLIEPEASQLLKGRAEARLQYVEFTTGFYMIVGRFSTKSKKAAGLRLFTNPGFLQDRYIISPELTNILEGRVAGITEIELGPSQPVFLILLRTNIASENGGRKQLDVGTFFGDCKLLEPSVDGEDHPPT